MASATHLYRPQRSRFEDLEAILVAREPILHEILGRLENGEPGASRQHYLIIGPRGIGKTHLLALIEHRIRRSAHLSARWCSLSLAEDAYSISRVSDFLFLIIRRRPPRTTHLPYPTRYRHPPRQQKQI